MTRSSKPDLTNVRENLRRYGAPDWEAEGYKSFYDFWQTKGLDRLTHPREAWPSFAYQMFAEGASTLDVALSIKGVGTTYAEAFKRQYDGGVPVDQARPTNRYDRVSQADLDSLSTHLT
jgi:hypothetical protein